MDSINAGTHITGGFLASAIQWKLTGYCDPYMSAFFAFAPDICNKESIISKSMSPLSWLVNKISKTKFKGSDSSKGKIKRFIEKFLDHRYITHCWIPLTLFYILYIYTKDIRFVNMLIGWGGGHVFLDLLNVRGVPLLFPLTNKHYKIPFFNITTGSRAEGVVNLLMWIVICGLLIPDWVWNSLMVALSGVNF